MDLTTTILPGFRVPLPSSHIFHYSNPFLPCSIKHSDAAGALPLRVCQFIYQQPPSTPQFPINRPPRLLSRASSATFREWPTAINFLNQLLSWDDAGFPRACAPIRCLLAGGYSSSSKRTMASCTGHQFAGKYTKGSSGDYF